MMHEVVQVPGPGWPEERAARTFPLGRRLGMAPAALD